MKKRNPLDKIVTMDDARKFNPCYLGVYAPEGWSMRLSGVLKLDACPAPDRIWLVLRFLPKATCVDFAWRCAFFAAASAASDAREASDAWTAWTAAEASAAWAEWAASAAADAAAAAAELTDSAVSAELAARAASDAAAWAGAEVSDAQEHERQMQIEYLLEILS